jgi:hypothetical protein
VKLTKKQKLDGYDALASKLDLTERALRHIQLDPPDAVGACVEDGFRFGYRAWTDRSFNRVLVEVAHCQNNTQRPDVTVYDFDAEVGAAYVSSQRSPLRRKRYAVLGAIRIALGNAPRGA